MTSTDVTPSTAALTQVQYRTSLGLIVVSVLTLASIVVAPRTLVNEMLFWLLLFVGGMLLGIVWCKQVLRRPS